MSECRFVCVDMCVGGMGCLSRGVIVWVWVDVHGLVTVCVCVWL